MEKKFSGDEKNIEINEENVKGYINRYLVSRSLIRVNRETVRKLSKEPLSP
jgi:hypothetical protein